MRRKGSGLDGEHARWRAPAPDGLEGVVDLAAWRDGATDPEVVALLREAYGAPPYDRVDWDRLHTSIVRDAGRSLTGRRQRAAWLGAVAGWAVAAIPAGVLAGAAAAYVLAATPFAANTYAGAANARMTGGAVTSVALAGVVTGAVSAQTLADSVAGPLHADAIVRGLLP